MRPSLTSRFGRLHTANHSICTVGQTETAWSFAPGQRLGTGDLHLNPVTVTGELPGGTKNLPFSQRESVNHEHNAAVVRSSSSALIEPLSERERDVLRLLAQGRSNQEIARYLVVAVSTVKTHLHHLFAKLQATDRFQAVLRPKEIGLLDAGSPEAKPPSP